MASLYGLDKGQKLKSRKAIQALFQEGKGFSIHPLRIIYNFSEERGAKAGFSVSKRYFKRAVDRNRIKRLMREAYRLQKTDLIKTVELKEKGVHFFLTYTGNELPLYEEVFSVMNTALKNLVKRIDKA